VTTTLSLIERLNQALGLAPELIVPHRPPPEIVVETRLEYPVAEQAALESLLEHLLDQVVAELAARQQGAIRLECQLQCDDGRRIDVPVGLYQASADREHLLELLLMRVERLALSAPLIAVRLAVLLAAPLEWRQRELFEETSMREGRRQLALLINRLSNRLGRESVVGAHLEPDAQPELSVRYEPLTGLWHGLPTMPHRRPKVSRARRGVRRLSVERVERSGDRPTTQSHRARHWQTSLASASLRPLHLETPPAPLQVLSLAPEGPPLQFCWRGDWRRVARAWGPERIQTGWWRGPYVQRDYYRVETTEGARFWLFRRLTDAAWFLHGVFE
jgi:protein ImuB